MRQGANGDVIHTGFGDRADRIADRMRGRDFVTYLCEASARPGRVVVAVVEREREEENRFGIAEKLLQFFFSVIEGLPDED